jgi:hypothetical protein
MSVPRLSHAISKDVVNDELITYMAAFMEMKNLPITFALVDWIHLLYRALLSANIMTVWLYSECRSRSVLIEVSKCSDKAS